MKLAAGTLTVAVLIHHAIAVAHGGAHADLAIPIAAWQNAFVNTVVIVLPLAGVGLVWTAYRHIGFAAVAAGMLGALVFGIVHHYVLVSPDHIAHLPVGRPETHDTFRLTAGLVVIAEALTLMVAAYCLGRFRRRGAA